jgi:hypothetical protein
MTKCQCGYEDEGTEMHICPLCGMMMYPIPDEPKKKKTEDKGDK